MERMHAFIAHGYQGNRNEHFIPGLAAMLKDDGHKVTRLTLRNADRPHLIEWVGEMLGNLARDDMRKLLIGHSLGVSANLWAMRLKTTQNIAGAFHIAGSARELDAFPAKIHGIDPRFYFANPLKSLREERYKGVPLVHRMCPHFVYAGTDEPYVPHENSTELAHVLCTHVQWFEGGGHLNTDTCPHVRRKMMEAVRNDIRKLSGYK